MEYSETFARIAFYSQLFAGGAVVTVLPRRLKHGLMASAVLGVGFVAWVMWSSMQVGKGGTAALATFLGTYVAFTFFVTIAAGSFWGLIVRSIQSFVPQKSPNQRRSAFLLTTQLVIAIAPSAAFAAFSWNQQRPPNLACVKNGVPLSVNGFIVAPPPNPVFQVLGDFPDRRGGWVSTHEAEDRNWFCDRTADGTQPLSVYEIHFRKLEVFYILNPSCRPSEINKNFNREHKIACEGLLEDFYPGLGRVEIISSTRESRFAERAREILKGDHAGDYRSSDGVDMQYSCSDQYFVTREGKSCAAFYPLAPDVFVWVAFHKPPSETIPDRLEAAVGDVQSILALLEWRGGQK